MTVVGRVGEGKRDEPFHGPSTWRRDMNRFIVSMECGAGAYLMSLSLKRD